MVSGKNSSKHSSYDEREEKNNSNQKRMRVEDSDRLSDLPDQLLINILSKLKAKQVAQTCVLSKRWHKLWTTVPSLDLDFSEFSDLNRFENFVSTFLSGRDDAVNVDTFNLNYLCPPDDPIVESSRRWIHYAVKHNPKNLQIVMYGSGDDHNPPIETFVCGSLEEMMVENFGLNSPVDHIFSDRIALPKLRKLHLSGADFDADSMQYFFSGCPTLESLNLNNCFMNVKEISFQTVKQLSISWISNFSDWGLGTSGTFVISGPCLEYLHLDKVFVGIILKDMSKVATAKISIWKYSRRYNSELLSSLSGVEDLHLENVSLTDMLKGELPRCPKFHKLKKLTLGRGCMYCDGCLLSSFLKNCPNLEQLIFLHTETEETCKVFMSNGHGEREMIWKLEQVKRVGCHSLKLVNVVNCRRKKLGLLSLQIKGTKIIFTSEDEVEIW